MWRGAIGAMERSETERNGTDCSSRDIVEVFDYFHGVFYEIESNCKFKRKNRHENGFKT